MIIINRLVDVDRSEAYRRYAEGRADGQVVVPPLLLDKHARREHVRLTLREDHQFRIKNRPEGAQAKFDKLAGSVYSFFRGSALLYYRDYAGTDAHLPLVFTLGDAHPENFGVMPNQDGAPFFGANDFDEAWVAPFSYDYDVKRCAVGFYLVAKENGVGKKGRRKIVRAFVDSYLKALVAFARDDRENSFQFRIDNSPAMISELLEDARESRASFLAKLIDMDKGEFIPSAEIVPHSRQVKKFQRVIDKYKKETDIPGREKPKNFFKVKDVALKKGSGTASLGLDRYFVLLEGWGDDISDSVVLELKQARRSALYGLVPDNDFDDDEKAQQVVTAQQVHLVGGDPFYGRAVIDKESFLVRERSPFKDDIDVDDLDKKDLKTYARICGRALAQTHARSDEDTGIMEGDAEWRILESINNNVFCDDIVRFAHHASKRVYADHKLFKKDHALGVFTFLDDA